jgi:hypothetical protein
MKELTVHKVGVGSLGRLVGTWAAILGLIVGVLAAIVSVVAVFESNDYSVLGGLGVSALIVLGWTVVYPLVMFAFGWLQGAIIGLVFNLVVSGSGGLAIQVSEGAVSTKK